MFERFTSHARRVLALAQEEARFLGHNQCGSEHLLIGLIRDEGPAGEALKRQGISLDAARKAVSDLRGRDQANLAQAGAGSLPFSANAKTAVQAAVNDATASQSPVDSNHLLFGVLREQSPTVQAVIAALRGGPAAAAPAAPVAPPAPPMTPPAPAYVPPVQPAVQPVAPPAVQHSSDSPLAERVDELTRRVDHLQAMVNQLSKASSNTQR